MNTSTCYAICAAAAALLFSSAVGAQVKTTIFVAPTEWETRRADWFGTAEQKVLEEQLAEGLDATGRFRMIDVEDVKVVDGKGLRGAQLMIGCAIKKAKKTEQKGKDVKVLGLGQSQKVRSTYEIEMEVTLFNTRTQMDLTSAEVEIKKSYEDAVRGANIAGINFKKERTYSNDSAGQVIKELVDEAVRVIDDRVRTYGWRSTVKGIVNGKPVILGGSRDGLKMGMQFDIIEKTEPLIDDDTGEILDEGDETTVGRLAVIEVKDKVSYCQKLSGRDPAKGDMVRLDEGKKRVSAPGGQKVTTASN